MKKILLISCLFFCITSSASTTIWKNISDSAVSGYHVGDCNGYGVSGTYLQALESVEEKIKSSCSSLGGVTKNFTVDYYDYSIKTYCSKHRWRSWIVYSSADCIYSMNETVDAEFYMQIANGHRSGLDYRENAIKICTLAEKEQLDKDFYLQIRQGPYKGKDTYEDAGKASVDAKSGVIDGEFYLEVRMGPKSGVDNFKDAYTASRLVREKILDANCYLYNRKGIIFGDKSYEEAIEFCSL